LTANQQSITPSQISNLLQQRIFEESDIWKFEKIVQPELLLNLRVKSSSGRNIHVRLDDIHDRIYLIARMRPTELQQKAFGLVPAQEKKRFLANLMVSLYSLGIEAAKEETLQVNLQKFVYFDGLTKDKFLNLSLQSGGG
jgi:hypothetical protein